MYQRPGERESVNYSAAQCATHASRTAAEASSRIKAESGWDASRRTRSARGFQFFIPDPTSIGHAAIPEGDSLFRGQSPHGAELDGGKPLLAGQQIAHDDQPVFRRHQPAPDEVRLRCLDGPLRVLVQGQK